MQAIPVYLSDGRPIGRIVGDVYYSTRKRSLHLLRHPLAWAIDRDILRELEARSVRRVIIRETEEGNTYEAALSDFTRHGVRVSRGYGAQIALPLAWWRVNGERSEAEARGERPAQLGLFGAEVLQ